MKSINIGHFSRFVHGLAVNNYSIESVLYNQPLVDLYGVLKVLDLNFTVRMCGIIGL